MLPGSVAHGITEEPPMTGMERFQSPGDRPGAGRAPTGRSSHSLARPSSPRWILLLQVWQEALY